MRNPKSWILALSFAVLATAGGRAYALPTGIYVTEQPQDPKSKTFEKDVKKHAKAAVKRDGTVWHINFVAYLNKAAGAPEVNLVFYDVTGGKREQVNAFPINTREDAKIILSSVEINPEMDFKVGHKYDVLVTRLIGGKEVVYARTKLDLK